MRWLLLASFVGSVLLRSSSGTPPNENTVEEQPLTTLAEGSKVPYDNEQVNNELLKSESPLVVEEKKQDTLYVGEATSVEGSVSTAVVKQAAESGASSPVTLKPVTEIKITTTAEPIAVAPVKPLAEVSSTTAPERRYPCRCGSGICSCCTGLVLENFNVPIRSRACANITYEPDDFAFNFKLLYNNRVLYDTRMSAKNPRPVCIPINRYFGVKMCAKLSNVYMSGRNIHACLNMEGFWDDESAFNYSFNCFRIGSSGVAVVRPEDGGGLPPPPDEEEQTDEDYDDTARR